MKLLGKHAGFTIVELLVTIVVIAILATLVTVSYNGLIARGNDATTKTNAGQVLNKIAVYYTQNGSYPTTLSELGFTDSGDMSYTYTATSTTFCVGVTKGSISYYVSDTTSTPTQTACEPSVTLPTPIAAWNFNEGSGNTAADSSGNGNTLTKVGSPWTASGKTGAGLNPSISNYFSRSSGFGDDTLDTWTVSMWFNRTSNLSTQYGQFMHDDQDFWMEMVTAGNWGYSGSYSSNPLPLNTWHHLTWVTTEIDGSSSQMVFYLDGQQSHQTTYGTNFRLLYEDHSWTIGRGPNNGSDGAVNGIIDDVRIYDSALTTEQIQQNMNS